MSVDVCGAVSLAAWITLALLARRPAVPLAAYFMVMATAWSALALAMRAQRYAAVGRLRVIGWAAAFRVVGLCSAPVLDDDTARYLWDGHVFATRGTPYGIAPLSAFARDHGAAPGGRVLDAINHPELPTIYGPLCQWVFRASHAVAPAHLLPLKLVLLAAELAGVLLLAPRLGAWVLALAWCPLAVHEVAFNAHLEPLAMTPMLFAMLFVMPSATPCPTPTPIAAVRGDVLAGAAMGASLAARPFALLIAPFILRTRWRGWAVAGAVLAAFYSPLLWRGSAEGVSWGAFASGWEFDSSLFALASGALGPVGARIACAGLLAAVVVTLLRRSRSDVLPPGDALYGAAFALGPVLEPWYALWLLPFAALRPSRAAWTALAAVSLSYAYGLHLPSGAGYEHPVWVRLLEFGLVALALALDLAKGRPKWGAAAGGQDVSTCE